MMKLAYIAGPYRGPTEWEVTCNIRVAQKAAARAWKSGYAVICPHLNTAHMGGVVEDSVILEGDLVMLRKCDVIILTPGWDNSAGARAEFGYAVQWGMPVCDYDEGRDRIVMRVINMEAPRGQGAAEALGRCNYCRDPQGDPRKAWVLLDGTVMCAGCVGHFRRCHHCAAPLLGVPVETAEATRLYLCGRCEASEETKKGLRGNAVDLVA